MPRPTRRGAGLAFGALLLFGVGTNVQAGWLFVLGSLLLAAVVVGLLVPPLMLRRLEIERRAPDEAFAGDDVRVDLVVRNRGRGATLSLELRDQHVAPADAFIPVLGGREEVIVETLRRAARRGVVDGGPIRVSSSAPFATGRARREVPAAGRTVVYPRIVPVGPMPELFSSAKPLEAATVQARKGTGGDFLGVREYRAGDAMRHVHWPSTARHGGLMVREFEQELPRRLGVLVDTWADADSDAGETPLDVCCSVAASVTLASLTAGHPVALTAAGRDGMRTASAVASDPATALEFLAELEAPAGTPLPVAMEGAGQALGRLDTLLLCFPTWRPNSVEMLLPAVARFEDAALQIVAAVMEVSLESGRKPVPIMAPADVDELVRSLASREVAVYRIGPGEDPAACMQRPSAA